MKINRCGKAWEIWQKFHFYRNIAEHVNGNEIHKHHVDASMSVHEIVEKYLPANFAKFENLLEEGSTDDKMLIIKDFQIHHDEIGAMLIQSPALKIRIEKVPLKIKNGELHLAGFVARTYGKADMCHYAAVSHNANSESTPFIEFDDCRKTGKSFKNKYILISAALYVKV